MALSIFSSLIVFINLSSLSFTGLFLPLLLAVFLLWVLSLFPVLDLGLLLWVSISDGIQLIALVLFRVFLLDLSVLPPLSSILGVLRALLLLSWRWIYLFSRPCISRLFFGKASRKVVFAGLNQFVFQRTGTLWALLILLIFSDEHLRPVVLDSLLHSFRSSLEDVLHHNQRIVAVGYFECLILEEIVAFFTFSLLVVRRLYGFIDEPLRLELLRILLLLLSLRLGKTVVQEVLLQMLHVHVYYFELVLPLLALGFGLQYNRVCCFLIGRGYFLGGVLLQGTIVVIDDYFQVPALLFLLLVVEGDVLNLLMDVAWHGLVIIWGGFDWLFGLRLGEIVFGLSDLNLVHLHFLLQTLYFLEAIFEDVLLGDLVGETLLYFLEHVIFERTDMVRVLHSSDLPFLRAFPHLTGGFGVAVLEGPRRTFGPFAKQELGNLSLLNERMVEELAVVAGDGEEGLVFSVHFDIVPLVLEPDGELEDGFFVGRSLQMDLLVGVDEFRIQNRGDFNVRGAYFLVEGLVMVDEEDLDFEAEEALLSDVVAHLDGDGEFFVETLLVVAFFHPKRVFRGNEVVFAVEFEADQTVFLQPQKQLLQLHRRVEEEVFLV